MQNSHRPSTPYAAVYKIKVLGDTLELDITKETLKSFNQKFQNLILKIKTYIFIINEYYQCLQSVIFFFLQNVLIVFY